MIQSALISERKALEALQLRASLSNPGDREALLANPDAIDVPIEQIAAGQVFVADVAGSLGGFADIFPRDVATRCLLNRACGGAALAGNAARTRGSSALHVIGNPHAEGFYRACGFELTWNRADTVVFRRRIVLDDVPLRAARDKRSPSKTAVSDRR